MRFSKMHGLGNDFIVVDGRSLGDLDYNALAPRLCHRRTGVGADGILVLYESDAADFGMRIVNSDGSEAEMCGNGIRCFAKYVYDNRLSDKDAFTVETLSGIKTAWLHIDGGKTQSVTIDMGTPSFQRADVPMLGEGDALHLTLTAGGRTWDAVGVDVGIPHTVVFVDDPDAVDICAIGPEMETLPVFPRRTNVDFVRVVDDANIIMRTWERGAGRTLACGTGVSAAAVACAARGLTRRSVDVSLELGVIHIDWREDGRAYMRGPAALSYTGEVEI